MHWFLLDNTNANGHVGLQPPRVAFVRYDVRKAFKDFSWKGGSDTILSRELLNLPAAMECYHQQQFWIHFSVPNVTWQPSRLVNPCFLALKRSFHISSWYHKHTLQVSYLSTLESPHDGMPSINDMTLELFAIEDDSPPHI